MHIMYVYNMWDCFVLWAQGLEKYKIKYYYYCSRNAHPCPYKAHMDVLVQGTQMRFVPSCVNGERAVGVLWTGGGRLKNNVPTTPTLL